MRVHRFLLSIFMAIACAAGGATTRREGDFPIPAPRHPPKIKGAKKAASAPAARLSNPLLRTVYDGSRRSVVARCKTGQEVNEEDLLLYGLLIEAPDPEIYDLFVKEQNPDKKAELRGRLMRRIIDLLCLQAAGAQGAAGGGFSEWERLAARTIEHPVWEFVWIHRVIWPQVTILPGDERHYYISHPKEFITPRRATVRYIFRPLDPSFPSEDALLEEQLMESLHKGLLDNPAVFPEAARQYSQAPSAKEGGLLPSFEPGQYFPEFDQWVFERLEPGEISSVVRGPKGLYLIQLVDSQLPEPIPFEKAQPRLSEAVRIHQTRARAEYEIGRMRDKRHPEERFGYWDQLLDSSRVARVGDVEVTKGDFLRLYPDILTPTGMVSLGDMTVRARRFVDCELIGIDLRKKGLEAEPRVARAHAMAEMLLRARRVESQWLAEQMKLDPAGTDALASRKLGADKTPPRKRLFRIWAEIDNPRLYDATTLANLREGLPRALQGYIDKAEAARSEGEPAERAGQAPEAVRKAANYAVKYYKFHWADLGYVDLRDAPPLADLLRTVSVGRFSAVETQGENAAAYYVGAEKKIAPEAFEEFRASAQRTQADERRTQLLGIYRDAIAQGLGISFAF